MNDDVRRQARDIVEDVAGHDAEVTDSFEKLKIMEKQMADLSNMVLGNKQTSEGFIGSEAESEMMAMARGLAKTDPETAALLKELEESEKQIAGLMGILDKQKLI